MRKISRKQRRQHALKQIIKEREIATQEDLQRELKDMGIEVTQSSLSRDLNELGVIKQKGYYHLHTGGRPGGILPPVTAAVWAGPNLFVLKTYPSMAPSMGAIIDEQNISGIVGTVAGDDTVFVATGPSTSKEDLEKHIRRLFG